MPSVYDILALAFASFRLCVDEADAFDNMRSDSLPLYGVDCFIALQHARRHQGTEPFTPHNRCRHPGLLHYQDMITPAHLDPTYEAPLLLYRYPDIAEGIKYTVYEKVPDWAPMREWEQPYWERIVIEGRFADLVMDEKENIDYMRQVG